MPSFADMASRVRARITGKEFKTHYVYRIRFGFRRRGDLAFCWDSISRREINGGGGILLFYLFFVKITPGGGILAMFGGAGFDLTENFNARQRQQITLHNHARHYGGSTLSRSAEGK